jgi:hypothetical protein
VERRGFRYTAVMSVRAVQVVVVGSWLASCTAHGEPATIEQEQAQEQFEPDRFAWLATAERPRLEGDLVLAFAGEAIRLPDPPGEPIVQRNTPLSMDVRMLGSTYEDRPEVPGLNAALGVPFDAKPTLWSIGATEHSTELRWEIEGELGGFERITRDHQDKRIRVDGFDPRGEWRRAALFEYGPRWVRRVEFGIVEGKPVRRRTLVFEGDRVIAVIRPEQVEYRYWRTDNGERAVVFELHPDRLVRTAQVYEGGVPHERVDTFEVPKFE